MFTTNKFLSLTESAQQRKAAGFLRDTVSQIINNQPLIHKENLPALKAAVDFNNSLESKELFNAVIQLISDALKNPDLADIRRMNILAELLEEKSGYSPPSHDKQETLISKPQECISAFANINPMNVFLDDIRSPYNLGSIFRSAGFFGIEKIILSPMCPDPNHPRCLKTAMGCTKNVSWEKPDNKNIMNNKTQQLQTLLELGPVFALETGGTDIDGFDFPLSGTVILGHEEFGISKESLEAARKSAGIVSIPGFGLKGSLNVSCAFAILMNSWCTRTIDKNTKD